jgi:hypothetical protein
VLDEVCQGLAAAGVLFSEAVVAYGHALYGAALALGYEGVLAKHLAVQGLGHLDGVPDRGGALPQERPLVLVQRGHEPLLHALATDHAGEAQKHIAVHTTDAPLRPRYAPL